MGKKQRGDEYQHPAPSPSREGGLGLALGVFLTCRASWPRTQQVAATFGHPNVTVMPPGMASPCPRANPACGVQDPTPRPFSMGWRGPCPAFVAEGAAGTRAAVNPLIVPRHISATFSSMATTQQGLNHITERAGKGNKTPAEQAASACTPQTLSPSPVPVPKAGCSPRPHLVPAPGMAQQQRGAPWGGISCVHRYPHTSGWQAA